MTKTFDKKLFAVLVFVFVFMTAIGTVLHELGHYVVARGLGRKARIHYAASVSGDASQLDSINAIYSKYKEQVEQGLDFADKKKYETLVQSYIRDDLWISAGGPLQTMLTGTIGLILLVVWKRSFATNLRLRPWQWMLVFPTLFWLRQSANFVVWLGSYLITKEFSFRSDEVRIALQLNLPFWSLTFITGLMGLYVLAVVIFKFIPKPQRLTFMVSGIVGGITGYFLWLEILGPVLIP